MESQILFNIGESGLGKTTFINAFFKLTGENVLDKKKDPIMPSTKKIEEYHLPGTLLSIPKALIIVVMNGMDITVIDTPGYGDTIDNEDW